MPKFAIGAPPELLRGDSRDMQQLRHYLMQLCDALCDTLNNLDGSNVRLGGLTSASFKNLSVEMLKAAKAEISRAKIGWAQVQHLETKVAEICTATIETADIDWANILDLTACIADIGRAEIENADIDFAQVKDLTADKAIITKGVNGKLYVTDLAVTEANMVSLTTGALMVKGQDGSFYQITVTADGDIEPVLVEVEGDNVADGTIPGGKLIENTITARELNVDQIFANEAVMIALTANMGKFGNLFANEAVVGQLKTHLIESDYLKIVIKDTAPTTYVQEEEPTEGIKTGDFWVHERTLKTWADYADTTWDALGDTAWDELYDNEKPRTYVYNGNAWVLASDAAREEESYMLSLRTAEQLLEYAKQVDVDALAGTMTELDAQLKLTAQEVELRAKSSTVEELTGRVESAEGTLKVQADEIEARVEKNGVIGAINLSSEEARIEAAKIMLEGLVTANENFKVLLDGSIEALNANISGKITSESGSIGGWDIAPGALVAGSGAEYVGLSTADAMYRMWVGAEAPEEAPFRVTKGGAAYLTRLYVTDENGVAQATPVNLNTSYWKVDAAYARAVKTLQVVGDTLTITLNNGTTVNFKKAGYTAAELQLQQGDPQGRAVFVYDSSTHSYNCQKTVYLYDTGGNYLGLYSTVNETSGTEAYDAGYSAGNGAGYNTGFAAGKESYLPTVISRTGYSTADKTVTVKAANSHQDLLTNKVIDASEIYTAGYAAGWAAAKAKIALSGNQITGPSTTVDGAETLYTVTAGGSINQIQNTAANYFRATGYGRAYVNGSQVNYTSLSYAQQINVGQ